MTQLGFSILLKQDLLITRRASLPRELQPLTSMSASIISDSYPTSSSAYRIFLNLTGKEALYWWWSKTKGVFSHRDITPVHSCPELQCNTLFLINSIWFNLWIVNRRRGEDGLSFPSETETTGAHKRGGGWHRTWEERREVWQLP